MLRQFTLISFSLLALSTLQPAQAQVYFAPEAGVTFGKINTRMLKNFYYTDAASNPQLSYQGGLGFRIFLNKNLAIQTGVFYERLSYNTTYYNEKFPSFALPQIQSYAVHYGQIALSLSYFHELGSTGSVFGGLGGYVMNAFSAKLSRAKTDLSLGSSSRDVLKPIDAGALGYIGYQFRFGGFLRLQYSYGLRNLSTMQEYYSNYSSGLSLTMGFRLRMETKEVNNKKEVENKQW